MYKIEDIIKIKTKATHGPYVQHEAEEFNCIKLQVPELHGINSKLHMHILRLDRFEREIIPLRRIEAVNGVMLVADAQTQWIVQGSKGNKYTVKLTGKGYSCTCPGYTFRKTCKHIEGIKHE